MRIPSLAMGLLIAGCTPSPSTDKPVSLANPASTYCVEQGGTVEIRSDAKGQTGYCRLPDGRVVEEWEFFRSQEK
jgi:putative hemolysin